MKVIETKVYEYDELSDKAKEKARDWLRRCQEGENDFADCVIEDAQRMAELMGIEFATRPVKLMGGSTRQDPCVYWSGFSSQGDGACFEGTWAASNVKRGAVKEEARKDTELHRIAAQFESIAKEWPQASFRVKHSGHYSHKGCTNFDVESGIEDDDEFEKAVADHGDFANVEEALIETARDFMQWIYEQLQKEWEYQNSDEQVAETIRANEYTFTESGQRF